MRLCFSVVLFVLLFVSLVSASNRSVTHVFENGSVMVECWGDVPCVVELNSSFGFSDDVSVGEPVGVDTRVDLVGDSVSFRFYRGGSAVSGRRVSWSGMVGVTNSSGWVSFSPDFDVLNSSLVFGNGSGLDVNYSRRVVSGFVLTSSSYLENISFGDDSLSFSASGRAVVHNASEPSGVRVNGEVYYDWFFEGGKVVVNNLSSDVKVLWSSSSVDGSDDSDSGGSGGYPVGPPPVFPSSGSGGIPLWVVLAFVLIGVFALIGFAWIALFIE